MPVEPGSVYAVERTDATSNRFEAFTIRFRVTTHTMIPSLPLPLVSALVLGFLLAAIQFSAVRKLHLPHGLVHLTGSSAHLRYRTQSRSMKTYEAMLGVLGCISLFAIASAPALAQHGHKTSPYAHGQSSEVSSLTADEVRELRNGEGMGLARAAELNHFPGPKHLLELASELDLDPAQVERIEAIHKRMKGQAIAKGEEILEAESHLANLFSSGQPSVTELRRVTQQVGIMRGQLQAIHLLAHIESAGVLVHEQIEDYDRLRGYRH